MGTWDGDRSDREDVAAQALAALAGGSGEACGGCGAEVERSGSGWACPNGCFRALCPVCGHDVSDFGDVCDHLLASPDYETGGWFYSPFGDFDLPQLEEAYRYEDETDELEDEEFGAAAPLLGGYEDGYYAPPFELELWERILGVLRVPVLEESWAGPIYYTPQPAAAHAQITTLIDLLEQGFRRLAERIEERWAQDEAEEDEAEEPAGP